MCFCISVLRRPLLDCDRQWYRTWLPNSLHYKDMTSHHPQPREKLFLDKLCPPIRQWRLSQRHGIPVVPMQQPPAGDGLTKLGFLNIQSLLGKDDEVHELLKDRSIDGCFVSRWNVARRRLSLYLPSTILWTPRRQLPSTASFLQYQVTSC